MHEFGQAGEGHASLVQLELRESRAPMEDDPGRRPLSVQKRWIAAAAAAVLCVVGIGAIATFVKRDSPATSSSEIAGTDDPAVVSFCSTIADDAAIVNMYLRDLAWVIGTRSRTTTRGPRTGPCSPWRPGQ